MQKLTVILLILAIISEGCSVSRRTGKGIEGTGNEPLSRNVLGAVLENNITNRSFYITKASVTVTQNKVSSRFTANLKFRKPDTLLLSLRSKLGIEAGRAFITSDTILINDRIGKNLITGNPVRIKSKYGIEPVLLYIILGDMIIEKNDMVRNIDCNGGLSKNEFMVGNKRIEYTIDCGKGKITSAYVEGDITSGNITLDFKDFVSRNDMIIPRIIEINDDMSSLRIEVKIEKIENNWNGNIEFIPGAGYEMIRFK